MAGGVSEIEQKLIEALIGIDAETYNIDIETPSGWIGRAPQSYTELTARMIIELIATLLRLLALGCCVVIRGAGIVDKQTIGPAPEMTLPEPSNTKKCEYKYSPSSEPRRRGPR